MPAGTIWITGLPAAGKSTLAVAVAQRLEDDGRPVVILDGDVVRQGLCADLGFSVEDRRENVRRVAEVAVLFATAGVTAVVALISPEAAARAAARAAHARAGAPFLEIWVDTPPAVCAQRDPKGLYARCAAGTLPGLTGVDAAYEPPAHPDVRVPGGEWPVDVAARRVLEAFERLRVAHA